MSEQDEIEKCLICVRISRGQLLIPAFDLWEQDEAIRIADKAAELIRDTYKADKFILCGKTPRGIIGGSLYVAGKLMDSVVTQKAVSEAAGCGEPTTRKMIDIIKDKAGVDVEELAPSGNRRQCKACEHLTEVEEWAVNVRHGGWYGTNVFMDCPESGVRIYDNSISSYRHCVHHKFRKVDEETLEKIKRIKMIRAGIYKKRREEQYAEGLVYAMEQIRYAKEYEIQERKREAMLR